ncbi:Lysophosphatidylcholine_acyltransferase/Lyso-PAF acetyltransferase [Hexamita inflata]|uniref:Lysophosphatidylcholine acyltransferase/Lyso-PAF acetyltransferase n=1 Tax=Hexamita inflata TaxID=28002 RepID=A0AA86THC8_9EUKA|nr:Lysophosphatidylcholine acyltransferase/Lyso-PAF acetyltransferase [Hexamita inflata]
MRMMIVKNPNAYALIPHVLFVLQRVPLEHVESFACSLKRKFLGDRCSQFTNFFSSKKMVCFQGLDSLSLNQPMNLRTDEIVVKLDQLVQIVAIKFHTAFKRVALRIWVQARFRTRMQLQKHIVLQYYSFIVTYKYLDVIENETSDQAGKRLAEALVVEYLPYTSNDWLYFSGKSDDLSKCTKEYLQYFGWMGQQKDYQEMCKLKKKNPLYYWDKKTLGVE